MADDTKVGRIVFQPVPGAFASTIGMVHRCGPGPCKDCRLKSAEAEIKRLRAEVGRLKMLLEER